MDIYTELNSCVIEARKKKNKVLVDVLNMLKTAIYNYSKDNGKEITDEMSLKVLDKEHKEMTKTLEVYEKNGASDELLIQTGLTIEICEQYLPKKMTEKEMTDYIYEVIDSYTEDKGNKLGYVMKTITTSGKKVDMAFIAKKVRELV